MSFYIRLQLFLTLFLLTVSVSGGNLRLPAIISDNMVLQAGDHASIWGWARPDSTITVSFQGHVYRVITGKNGKWMMKLSSISSGGPYVMTINDNTDSKRISNILVGDVWLCSGQSNMAMALSRSFNGKQQIAKAMDPKLRLFKVTKATSAKPMADCKGKWVECMPETARSFSAVAYYFGHKLRQELKRPIGLIQSAWGGTAAESWMSRDGIEATPILKNRLKKIDTQTLKALRSPKKVDDDDDGWMKPVMDEGSWEYVNLPLYWDYCLFPVEYDGVIWARKTIGVPSSWAGRELVLSIGKIDDYETTYYDGTEVGKTTTHTLKTRVYTIPASLVKGGNTTIAIQTFKRGWGGICGRKKDMYLALADKPAEKISLAGTWKYKPAKLVQKNISPRLETTLYNAMISPLVPYALTGVIWYQGEANANPATAFSYRQIFPALIHDWRSKWQQQKLPFYYVQLASFKTRLGECWPLLRESQLKTLATPETGMAVTIDIGNPTDIHPRNKQDVGERLSRWALAKVYGKKVEFSGPLYDSMKVEGSKIRLTFTNTTGGLNAENGRLKTFEIKGEGGAYLTAKAKIEGDTVVVWHPELTQPIAVRYAWKDNPGGCNLYNGVDLPASPFRTEEK